MDYSNSKVPQVIPYGPAQNKMINMYVEHSLVYQVNGTDNTTITPYPLRPCNVADFNLTKDFNLTNDTRFDNDPSKYSCIDDPANTLSLIGSDRARTPDNN